MATVTTGYTFVNNETVTPAKLNSLAGAASVSGIVDADVSASAAIVDAKLATISTAGKVSNSATTATSANTASAIVARDASGNFTAGTITANTTGIHTGAVVGNVTGAVTGNASTATTLAGTTAYGLAKAWINFNGAGAFTIGTPTAANNRSAYNVSTVTKNGSGDFTITFSTALPNANYAAVITAQGPSNNVFSAIYPGTAASIVTTTYIRCVFRDSAGASQDPPTASVVIFGAW